MRRIATAIVAAALASVVFAAPAAAGCDFCPATVSVQTPDGLAWSPGKPATVVIAASRPSVDAEFPSTGLIVVMRTDGDRTKCLDVPLKLVRADGDTGLYAGVFYPFRAAAYDGKVRIGDDTSDIRFDVGKVAGAASLGSDLPVGTTEEADYFSLPAGPISVAITAFALGLALVAGSWHARSRRRTAATVA
jgi:hypothetical protein